MICRDILYQPLHHKEKIVDCKEPLLSPRRLPATPSASHMMPHCWAGLSPSLTLGWMLKTLTTFFRTLASECQDSSNNAQLMQPVPGKRLESTLPFCLYPLSPPDLYKRLSDPLWLDPLICPCHSTYCPIWRVL